MLLNTCLGGPASCDMICFLDVHIVESDSKGVHPIPDRSR